MLTKEEKHRFLLGTSAGMTNGLWYMAFTHADPYARREVLTINVINSIYCSVRNAAIESPLIYHPLL